MFLLNIACTVVRHQYRPQIHILKFRSPQYQMSFVYSNEKKMGKFNFPNNDLLSWSKIHVWKSDDSAGC